MTEVLNTLNVRLKQNIELSEKAYKLIYNSSTVLYDTDYYDKGLEYMKLYYPNDRLPFNDCVYMALMEDLEIKEIATFDSHFDLNKNITRIH